MIGLNIEQTYDAKFSHGMIWPGADDRGWDLRADRRGENVGHSGSDNRGLHLCDGLVTSNGYC